MNRIIEDNKPEMEFPPIMKRLFSTALDYGLLAFIIYLILEVVGYKEDKTVFMFAGSALFQFLIYEPILVAFACTFGQYMLNIRVRDIEDDEEKISIANAYKRTILKALLGWVSFITINIKPERRAIHDMAGKSVVIFSQNKSIFSHPYVKFGIITICYILWVIWVGNYWLLFGLPVIFDMHITKKVNWTFWKKRGVKKHKRVTEWVDALIFAVVAATFIRMFFIEAFTIPTSSMEKTLLVGDYLFVSKVSYGPKLPNTPLSIPFVPHTMPTTESTPSFLTWIDWPYKRIAGFGEVKRNDIVVFNFPEGDTVASRVPEQSYYQLCRDYGRERIWTDKRNFGEIVVRPVDKREFYIKRCVAIAGDTLYIKDGQVYINGVEQEHFKRMQYNYFVQTNGTKINDRYFDNLEVSDDDSRSYNPNFSTYDIPLMSDKADAIKGFANVNLVQRKVKPDTISSYYIFPHSELIRWNEDNFGPMWIPKKGMTIELTKQNLPIYERIIGHYEGNQLEVKNEEIFINGQKATTYTFKMDYFWMMGDNRHNSADSRYWGFVPEDHVVGKAVFIWMSLDKDKGWFDGKIRWDRLFRFIH